MVALPNRPGRGIVHWKQYVLLTGPLSKVDVLTLKFNRKKLNQLLLLFDAEHQKMTMQRVRVSCRLLAPSLFIRWCKRNLAARVGTTSHNKIPGEGRSSADARPVILDPAAWVPRKPMLSALRCLEAVTSSQPHGRRTTHCILGFATAFARKARLDPSTINGPMEAFQRSEHAQLLNFPSESCFLWSLQLLGMWNKPGRD